MISITITSAAIIAISGDVKVGVKIRRISADSMRGRYLMTNKRLKGYRHTSCDEREEIKKYIENIDDDPLAKELFILRYIKGYSWQAVAYRCGGNVKADGCRKIVMRYLAKH